MSFVLFYFFLLWHLTIQLTENLNVITDTKQAAKYEEFLANVSRRYIDNCSEVLKEDILEHAQKRANDLREQWSILRVKYNELDSLMCKFMELLWMPCLFVRYKMDIIGF